MWSSEFKPEQIIGLQERQSSIEQLEKLGNVWIGPDLAIEKPTIIDPKRLKMGGVVLNKKDLPPGLTITRGALRSLNLSVRSFFAQAGIDMRFHSGSLTDGNLEDIKNGKSVSIPVDIENHGQRAVELSGNIMRFFWANDRRRLRRIELLKTIKSGEFAVEGVEGEDWFLGGYDQDNFTTADEVSDEGLCVVTRLKPEKYYIPYGPEPIRKSATRNIRDELSELLKPIPAGMKLDFEISETPKIKVGSNIVAVINTGVGERGQKHIESSLIDSGSNWPIRTETLHGLKYVEFFLYRK